MPCLGRDMPCPCYGLVRGMQNAMFFSKRSVHTQMLKARKSFSSDTARDLCRSLVPFANPLPFCYRRGWRLGESRYKAVPANCCRRRRETRFGFGTRFTIGHFQLVVTNAGSLLLVIFVGAHSQRKDIGARACDLLCSREPSRAILQVRLVVVRTHSSKGHLEVALNTERRIEV